ncbi:hypothetical protein BGW36DRAFT_362096 [Talaromyces proteolyticus]|uniref:Uncharacterized protein n=1 Tax=Talaromyces proteolyticus TaxID=1131652 RepID=A0AAD4PYI2_9EURO|nr:uncharacterized protein BGW36DRAFT_362096 [Talaromyces proteolyticus]KAH8694284.1 hypothetical protein BGW36DRAFT_362096 [Talaromyces proteolyticus]
MSACLLETQINPVVATIKARGNANSPADGGPYDDKEPYPEKLPEKIGFWSLRLPVKQQQDIRATPYSGYAEARTLLPDQTKTSWEHILEIGVDKLNTVFKEVEDPTAVTSRSAVAGIVLSPDLQVWREEQHRAGRILPSKGYGLTRTSNTVIEALGIGDLPPPLLTNAALFGSGIANFLIGAIDSKVLLSNYCVDMGFFYEHGYDKVFPEYEPIIRWAATDRYAMATAGGTERRVAAEMGLEYIRKKISLEDGSVRNLSNKTAKMTRKEAIAVNVCECSLLGMAADMIAQGHDKGTIINDFAFGSPGTDVIDVGSDIHNSELFNSFLNTGDVTSSGVVTEESLRRVYDAYAHSCARMFTERWSDPGAKMCSMLFTWHIQNNRHEFLRRAVLGYPKVRSEHTLGQREADIDEVFDEELHTTGFSRPLVNACNGDVICDHVHEQFQKSGGNPLLKELWFYLSEGPLQYASSGVVDAIKEGQLAEGSRISMARAYAGGMVDDLVWFLAHASQHAWQVNYLFEAAMFGSLLDDGGLEGKLDRFT